MHPTKQQKRDELRLTVVACNGDQLLCAKSFDLHPSPARWRLAVCTSELTVERPLQAMSRGRLTLPVTSLKIFSLLNPERIPEPVRLAGKGKRWCTW
jgi:hypothetical protein